MIARSHPRLGAIAIAGFGVVGALAALARPTATIVAAVPSLVGAVAGVVVLLWLRRLDLRVGETTPSARGPVAGSWSASRRPASSRSPAAASACCSTALVPPGPGRSILPSRWIPAPPLPAGADLDVTGVSPFYTPNDGVLPGRHRADGARVDPETWTLRIHGMVEREVTLTLPELLELPTIERDITLSCVSNQVGGPYVGNARWLGVPLATVLELAGVAARGGPARVALHRRDDHRHADGGRPRRSRRDAGRRHERRAAAAGARLPGPDGRARPVRLRVGDQVAGRAGADDLRRLRPVLGPARLGRRGARSGRCRGSTRRSRSRPSRPDPSPSAAWPGRSTAASTAVEVRIDDGPWQAARLAAGRRRSTPGASGPSTGMRPRAATGCEVRAIDGDGVIQTEVRREPFPDGATGWHSVVMTVS